MHLPKLAFQAAHDISEGCRWTCAVTLDLVDRKVDGRCGSADTGAPVQAVVITDPVLATQILRSKAVDKLRFMYSFLDVVCTANLPSPLRPGLSKPCRPAATGPHQAAPP